MASLEKRGESGWRVVFRYRAKKKTFSIGDVSEADAIAYRTSTEELLGLLERGVVQLPERCVIEDFLYYRGKPPEEKPANNPNSDLTLKAMREAYLRAQENRLETTTLDGIRLHFGHLERILDGKSVVAHLRRAELQQYLEKRGAEWIDPERYLKARLAKLKKKKPSKKSEKTQFEKQLPRREKRHPSAATLKKEIVTLRTAWNWARQQFGILAEFPGKGLQYAKIEESLPYMTWSEAERRVSAGDDPNKVWECVFLKPDEITELLTFLKGREISPWVYVIFCFAAHTGARRSEIVRVLPSDVDLANNTVTIREKKRDKRKLTTRRVPISSFLKEVLTQWSKERTSGKTFFCKADGKAITPREAHNYLRRALEKSKWHVLRGWHVFRHSFISALASKGIDQRIIDDMVGHQTEEQRRRYRHLYPDVKQEAVRNVFG